MRIRTRIAAAMAGTACAGLTALGVGTAAPAGAQQLRPVAHASSVAPQQATAVAQSCWDDDCGWGWDDDDYGYGWGYGWGDGWGW
jgi:hypothetical protein